LANGGKVIDFSKYAKSKEPRIKEIKLSDYFDMGRSVASLNDSERETLKWLLNKTLYSKD
jgi:ClpP class serine protease